MFDVSTLLILIPGVPLLATLVTAALGRWVLGGRSHVPVIAATALSLAASLLLIAEVHHGAQGWHVSERSEGRGDSANHALRSSGRATQCEDQIGYEQTVTLWTWAAVDQARASGVDAPGDFRIDVTLRADALTAIMLAVVSFVSLVVAVYSIGYMAGEPGYWRFFTYIGLFVFSMLMLVSVSNFVLLYVFWEAVGLCSYLLIGYWYDRPAAAAAGMKAFLVNRVGDFGFALGVFLLWTTYGTLDFHDTVAGGAVTNVGILGQTRLADPALFATGATATAICLLLLLGACGKSAQFPLHVWLPDAMEGPSPVSALIHAATMVTAGVYLVARCAPLFVASADAGHVVAVVGGFTAVLGALIALTQTDLKRIFAYSTISQLGYMFLGLGVGTVLGVTAGMFHLFTHAFFKALLFLAAGSVMHAMGNVIDIRRLGGLRRRLPVTHWTFLAGCLALAGVLPFAGFWSKDMILAAVHEKAGAGGALYLVLYFAALATTFLTALYTFRAYFVTFFGPERIPEEAGGHAHESGRAMTGPLVILAVCAVAVGAVFGWTHGFADFLRQTPSIAFLDARTAPMFDESQPPATAHLAIVVLSTVAAMAGIALAAALYLGSGAAVSRLARVMNVLGLYRLSHGKFFFDELCGLVVVRPLAGIARACSWADDRVVDGLVDLCGRLPPALGSALRPMQNGMIQFYALAMILGLLVLFAAVFL
jgi:NADH-quinone oxidoreductase subunit L